MQVTYKPEYDLGIISDDNGNDYEAIQFQHGPIGENGVNGIQNEDLLNLLCVRMRSLNEKFPCRENSLVITKMEEALHWLEHRTKLRVEQGVEGKSVGHYSP